MRNSQAARRTRQRACAIVGAAVVLAAMWMLGEQELATSKPPASKASRPEQSGRLAQHATKPARPEPEVFDLIAHLEAKPARACVGEAVLVDARLHRGVAARVSIEGQSGTRVAMQFAQAGEHEVVALAQGWQGGQEAESTRVIIEECPGRRDLHLSHRFSTSEDDVVILDVEGTDGMDGPLTFEWTIDGDAALETEEPRLRRSLALRDQTGPTTSVAVSVDVIDGAGNLWTVRDAVTVNNPLWLVSRDGPQQLPVLAERFPRKQGDDLLSGVTIRNPLDDHGVEFSQVQIEGLPCDTPDDRRRRSVQASSAMATHRIGAGQTLRTEVRLPSQVDGLAVCTLDVVLVGATDAGEEVRASFVLEAGVHPSRSHPASATVARMSLRALVEAGLTRVSDDEMKDLLGDPHGEFELLSR